MVSSRSMLPSAAILLAAISSVHATARGLAWATDNNFAPVIGSKPMVTWYHHWEDGAVSQMPSKNEFVPMFWGTSKWDKWNSRKSDMNKKKPSHLMGFNEPDISSQSNMSPSYAAQIWMQEIQPWGYKGVKLISPAVAWDLDWTNDFINEVHKRGGYIDMIAVHWYGSWKDIATFKKFVSTARSRFNYKIWVTEVGVTSASNPTAQQAKDFMMEAFSWMDSTGYVDRASWFGCFESSKPPDSYATAKNAILKTGGSLNDMGYWYGYTSQPDRRDESAVVARDESAVVLNNRHSALARRIAAADAEEDPTAIHCDEICELRNAQLAKYVDEAPAEIVEA